MLADEMQKKVFIYPECGVAGIPVNINVLNWDIDQVVIDKSDGDGEEKPVKQEIENSFVPFLQSIDSCERYDREIGNIVEEEAPPYYLGQKSAEEVALIMESRINLILDERKES